MSESDKHLFRQNTFYRHLSDEEKYLIKHYADRLTPIKDKDLPEHLRNPDFESNATLFYGFNLEFPKEWARQDYIRWIARVKGFVPNFEQWPESATTLPTQDTESKDVDLQVSAILTQLHGYIRFECEDRLKFSLPFLPMTPKPVSANFPGITIVLYYNGAAGVKDRKRLAKAENRQEILAFIGRTIGLGQSTVEPEWYFDNDIHGATACKYASFDDTFLKPPPDPSTPKARAHEIA